MPTQTSFIDCAYSAWTQLCEYRETRKALTVQLLGGVAILGYRISAPDVTNSFGTMPAGIWHSSEYGTGPAYFQLYGDLDGELVWQAWFAWIVPVGVGSLIVTAAGNDTFDVPDDVTEVTMICVGGGGGGKAGDAIGATGGGGASSGAWSSNVSFAVTPGDTLTYHVGAGGATDTDGEDTWISTTAIAPINASQGCLAGGGFGTVPPGASNGCNVQSTVIGTGGHSSAGGGGSAGPGAGKWGGGGGGGGWEVAETLLPTSPTFGAGGTSTAGGAGGTPDGGAGGDVPPAIGSINGQAGTFGGGGGGGGMTGFGAVVGVGGTGGDGWLAILYSSVAVQATPIITVIESFDPDPVNEAGGIPQMQVALPTLTPEGQAALYKLLARAREKQDATLPDPTKHDQGNTADDGHGNPGAEPEA